MREYIVKGISHKVFDSIDEVPSNITYLKDWRKGDIGDWVLTDDKAVIQILRSGQLSRPRNKIKYLKYIGTCVGTFLAKPEYEMDTEKRDNIYTIAGTKLPAEILKSRDKLTSRESLFAQFVAMGLNNVDAYLRAYKTEDESYAKMQANILIKTERIRTALKEELKPLLKKLNIDEEFVLSGIKQIAELGDKDSDKLKALLELSDVLEMKESKREITALGGAVFKGFLPEDTEVVSTRPELEE